MQHLPRVRARTCRKSCLIFQTEEVGLQPIEFDHRASEVRVLARMRVLARARVIDPKQCLIGELNVSISTAFCAQNLDLRSKHLARVRVLVTFCVGIASRPPNFDARFR
jgi:hypothetical protein